MGDGNQLLTEVEAAKLLNVHFHSLAVWRSNGKHGIPFVKIGRAVRYRVADLLAWIDANTRNKSAAKREKQTA